MTDVQSADDVSLSDPFCGGVAPVVRLQWTDSATSTVNFASYALEVEDGELRLFRRHCVSTGTPVSRQTVATRVAAAAPSCAGSACAMVTLAVTDADGASYSVTAHRRTA